MKKRKTEFQQFYDELTQRSKIRRGLLEAGFFSGTHNEVREEIEKQVDEEIKQQDEIIKRSHRHG